MKRMYCILMVVCILLVGSAGAYDQPSVNLGLTSFLDGGPPAGPGFYFTEFFQYYTADEFSYAPIGPGGPPASNAEVDVWVSLNQFIYQSDTPLLFGGKWGLDVIVPLVCMDATDKNGTLADNGGGLGDVLVGPYLQWDPIMGNNGPIFMHRVEFQTIWPVGKYDDGKPLNPGSNFFSFNPYWAGTFFWSPKLTTSWRVHYLWNAKNHDPFIGSLADDTQAGEAWHVNFATAYEFIPKKLRAGINGYYFQQTDKSEEDGHTVSCKEKACAIGPGFLWSFSQDDHLFFNLYFESDTDYRPDGERFVLRWVHHFK